MLDNGVSRDNRGLSIGDEGCRHDECTDGGNEQAQHCADCRPVASWVPATARPQQLYPRWWALVPMFA